MKNKLSYLVFLIAFGVVACGDNDENNANQTPVKQVTTKSLSQINTAEVTGVSGLEPGVYSISVGADDNLKTGTYYQAEDNEKLLIIDNIDQKAESLFHAFPEQAFNMIESLNGQSSVDITDHEKITATLLDISSFKGTYQATLNDMDIDIKINEIGEITAGNSTCKLSGNIQQTLLPNMVKYDVSSQNCGDLHSVLQGFLVKDINYEPAAFRLINLNSDILDLWFYEN